MSRLQQEGGNKGDKISINETSTHGTGKLVCVYSSEISKTNIVDMGAIIPCTVNGYPTKALLDTGADATILSLTVYESLRKKPPLGEKYRLIGIGKNMTMDAWKVSGIRISFDDSKGYKWNVLVAPIQEKLIIGVDFMCHFGCVLDFNDFSFAIHNVNKELTDIRTKDGKSIERNQVKLKHCVTVPPRQIVRVDAETESTEGADMMIVSSNRNLDVTQHHCKGGWNDTC